MMAIFLYADNTCSGFVRFSVHGVALCTTVEIPHRNEETHSMATKKAAAKPVAKKVTATKKPAAAKAPAVKAAPAEVKPIKELMTKTELLLKLSEISGVERKEVGKVFAALEAVTLASLNKKGAGQFLLPGLLKITTTKVPAKKMPAIKAGTLVRNPGSGQMVPHAGRAAFTKPATVRVKVRPLKKIKDSTI